LQRVSHSTAANFFRFSRALRPLSERWEVEEARTMSAEGTRSHQTQLDDDDDDDDDDEEEEDEEEGAVPPPTVCTSSCSSSSSPS
jgi:hypothetical protein